MLSPIVKAIQIQQDQIFEASQTDAQSSPDRRVREQIKTPLASSEPCTLSSRQNSSPAPTVSGQQALQHQVSPDMMRFMRECSSDILLTSEKPQPAQPLSTEVTGPTVPVDGEIGKASPELSPGMAVFLASGGSQAGRRH